MLNHEGWSLLGILLLLLIQLLLALPLMHKEQTMEKRLNVQDESLFAVAGVCLRCAGVGLLAVLPGAVYAGGAARLGLAVMPAAGLGTALLLIVPRLKRSHPQALTLCEAAVQDPWARAGFAAVGAVAAVAAAAGAMSMIARVFAYVFSLHDKIALAASVLLCFVLVLLCTTAAREKMDRLQGILLAVMVIGTPVAALTVVGAEENMLAVLREALFYHGTGLALGRDIASDVLTGLCAIGLMLPMQRLFAVKSEQTANRGGKIAVCAMAVLAVSAAASGLVGKMAGFVLNGKAAQETVVMQLTELPALPETVSAVLTSSLVLALMLFVQDALRFAGAAVAWDIVQPLGKFTAEKPLRIWMDGVSLTVCAALYAVAGSINVPLENYLHIALLCGAVTGTMLLMRALGVQAKPLGQRICVSAGAASAAAVLLFVPEEWKMIGAAAVFAAAVIPLLICKEKAKKGDN